MRRLTLPRLFAVAVGALAFCGAAATAADAQLGNPVSRNREVGARTTIGAPNADMCSQYAAGGDLTDAALAACDQAIRSERLNRANEIATRINRGAIHLRRREGEPALADFDAVIELDRRHAEAHLNRGAALVMLGRPGLAVGSITEALSLGVREPHKAYFNRGAAREALGDMRGAYEDYTTALEIQPDWGPANAELARFVRTRQEQLANILNRGGTR
ncbi:serine/threonine kinase [alpha proteobacterium U9-1i]|nr:serine/threonine kinase [alpha proteobacterium U9-1i]